MGQMLDRPVSDKADCVVSLLTDHLLRIIAKHEGPIALTACRAALENGLQSDGVAGQRHSQQVLRMLGLTMQFRNLAQMVADADQGDPLDGLQDSLASFPKDDVDEVLQQVSVELVLTAHPTESTRRSIQRIVSGLADCLAEVASPARDDRIDALIEMLWLTSPARHEGLRIEDEITNGVAVLMHSIVPALTSVTRVLDACQPSSGGRMTFGTWIGGDRDGHPHVCADTLYRAASAQSNAIRAYYLSALAAFEEVLSVDDRLVNLPMDLQELAAEPHETPLHYRKRCDPPSRPYPKSSGMRATPLPMPSYAI